MWTPVVSQPEAKVPSTRSKHASILHGQHLYLFGGRNGNVPLKDFWRYHIAENKWELIDAKGDSPGCLQEHTIVGYKDNLYVFGGEVGFSNALETPLWMYNITANEWRKFRAPKGVATPKGRRSHTATVYQDSLYIYGGYQDLKGSTSELWAFHFGSETWHLLSQGGSEAPTARHRHTAVLHDNALWIHGGMTDLQEKSDFWRFDFVSRKWRSVRSKPGPGCLHSHCAVKFLSVMMLFGGERDNQALNEMWRFHFATEFWEKLSFPSTSKPMPRTQTTAFILSQFKTRGAVHYMGLNEQDYFGSQPDPEKRSITTIPVDEPQNNIKEESFYEEIDDSQIKNYTFAEPNNCLVDEEETPELKPKKIYEKLQTGLTGRTRNNFQKLQDEHSSTNSQNLSLKVKMSNLSKMSAYSTYSMFSNESNESLNIATEDKSSCHTMTDSVEDSSLTTPLSPSSVKLNFSMKKSQSMISSSSSSKDSSVGSVIARDKSLQSFTQALIHAEPEPDSKVKQEENIYETVEVKNPAKKSDSSYTFQSYDCSSRSSTLSSSNPPTSSSSTGAKPLMGTRVLPPRNSRIVDLELTSSSAYYSGDEMSSLSGYESIDGSDKNLESMTSFSNPNYLCPDAKTMVERKQQKNKYDETLARDESHQNFAAALNSPAESLISDYHDFHARLNHDLVDLNPLISTQSCQKPSVKITSFGASVHLRPRTTPVLPRRKPRPVSSGPLELSSKTILEQQQPTPSALSDDESSSKKSAGPSGGPSKQNKNQLSLLMYVLGGRLGQVTVFNGPISLWKLDLTKTF